MESWVGSIKREGIRASQNQRLEFIGYWSEFEEGQKWGHLSGEIRVRLQVRFEGEREEGKIKQESKVKRSINGTYFDKQVGLTRLTYLTWNGCQGNPNNYPTFLSLLD